MFRKNNTFVLQGVLFYAKKSVNFVIKMKKYIFFYMEEKVRNKLIC